SFALSQILVVVVRYYGGTNLGVPGLIHAYGHAAELALQASEIERKKLQCQATLKYPFEEEGNAYRVVRILEAQVRATEYIPSPEMKIEFDLDKLSHFNQLKEQFPYIEFLCASSS
ncbi:MAG: YigZ family protein, partial [Bacteroidota bacterium]|nr:YigZ family protein [Bacteroidota bacterium]MDX5431406.1 YigZ family protein [Bacteroidota bacterium]MDX5470134.1 YigZ family protein [Bacteroidota bacterium]